MSIGGAELLFVIAIAVILFGAPVLTFLLGYTLGKKRIEPEDADGEPARSESDDADEEPEAQ